VLFNLSDYRHEQYLKRRYKADYFISNILLRLFIFNRDHNECRNCGSKKDLTIDHVISVYREGENSYDNLQTLCRTCNSKKAP
jgi:5-methylcytosine-specific restriction endonuclease McrA